MEINDSNAKHIVVFEKSLALTTVVVCPRPKKTTFNCCTIIYIKQSAYMFFLLMHQIRQGINRFLMFIIVAFYFLNK